LSLDLHACGTFSYRQRTGFRNLDDVRVGLARERGLEHLESEKSYRLPYEERARRIGALFEGLACLEGGAKQTLHYTDVAPALVVAAVTKGGNHIFGHVIEADGRGLPQLKADALVEALEVFAGEIQSDIYVGWARGYLDGERAKLEAFAAAREGPRIRISHPREAFRTLAEALRDGRNEAWLA
jgi:CRISPR-associated protein Cst2